MSPDNRSGSRVWLSSTAYAVLVHVAVVGAALWVSSTPKASPAEPEAIRVKIAAPEAPEPVEEAPPPAPVPEPKKAEQPDPKPQPPVPAPAPQAVPELASTAEATPSARAVPLPEAAPPRPQDPPKPVATAAQQADYYSTLLGWLDRHKDYPRDARLRREQGVAQLYFRINREGRILSYRIEGSSGHKSLDDATIRMIERANPLPPIPDTMPNTEIELIVPVEFFLKLGRR